MPSTLTYPGVYVEEIPSGVRTIIGVATSITAFIGRALRGQTNEPIVINSFGDFEREFGGLWIESTLGYAVRDFYLNGGSQAIIVRLFHPDTAPTKLSRAKVSAGVIALEAKYEGAWGSDLRAIVDLEDVTAADLFNLTIRDAGQGGAVEHYFNLSVDQNSPRRADEVLKRESKLVRWDGAWPATSPDLVPIKRATDALEAALKDPTKPDEIVKAQDALWALSQDAVTQAESKLARARQALADAQNAGRSDTEIQAKKAAVAAAQTALAAAIKAMKDSVSDGAYLTIGDFIPPTGRANKKGLYALERVDLFNLLCIPPYKDPRLALDVDVNLISAAAAYCEERRAILLVDPPKDWRDKRTAVEKFNDPTEDHVGTRSKNAALFFPRLRQPNPLRENKLEDFVPCGAAAGIFARTDTQRGVWKAPAGFDAGLIGVPQLTVPLTNDENGELNKLGVNCLRNMPAAGNVVWGSRTLQGNDRLASEWKYIPVRRTALFLEESLYRALQWVVFEPNDEPLWSQIRLNVGAFMNSLFRQGAFQGSTPREAYFVKCDKETTTQNDIDRGIVNILVGFAPLKPAEFVVIKLQQIAGQIQV